MRDVHVRGRLSRWRSLDQAVLPDAAQETRQKEEARGGDADFLGKGHALGLLTSTG